MHGHIQVLYSIIKIYYAPDMNSLYICMFIVIISKTERKGELHVEAFGLSVTTMEEVFIKVGEDKDETLCAR